MIRLISFWMIERHDVLILDARYSMLVGYDCEVEIEQF